MTFPTRSSNSEIMRWSTCCGSHHRHSCDTRPSGEVPDATHPRAGVPTLSAHERKADFREVTPCFGSWGATTGAQHRCGIKGLGQTWVRRGERPGAIPS